MYIQAVIQQSASQKVTIFKIFLNFKNAFDVCWPLK
jgi:hypothetical protein